MQKEEMCSLLSESLRLLYWEETLKGAQAKVELDFSLEEVFNTTD